jgi:hypothetical protein
MNTSRLLQVILILLWCLIEPGFTEDFVAPGVGFVSPNGQYCVQLEVIDGILRLIIKDTKTQRVDDSIQSTGPLYLHWAADSKSFVTVEHISKGSYGKVVYLADDRWLSVEVKPPFKGKMDYEVINLQLKSDRVHYKFAVTKLSEDWTPIDHSFCELEVTLANGKVTAAKWTSASEAELVNMPGPDKPVCVPSMPEGTTACVGDAR